MKKIILFMMITVNGISFLHGMRGYDVDRIKPENDTYTKDTRTNDTGTFDSKPHFEIKTKPTDPSTGQNPTASDAHSSGNISPENPIALQSLSKDTLTKAEIQKLEEVFKPIELESNTTGKKSKIMSRIRFAEDRTYLINKLNEIKSLIKKNIQEIIEPKGSVREYALNDLPKEFTDGVKELENQILNAPEKKNVEYL